jgi:hypothetical protein
LQEIYEWVNFELNKEGKRAKEKRGKEEVIQDTLKIVFPFFVLPKLLRGYEL